MFKKKISTKDKRFQNRECKIVNSTSGSVGLIDIPDIFVLCNGCGTNLFDSSYGWLVYLDKESADLDRPYDVYCDCCVNEYFPKAKEIR